MEQHSTARRPCHVTLPRTFHPQPPPRRLQDARSARLPARMETEFAASLSGSIQRRATRRSSSDKPHQTPPAGFVPGRVPCNSPLPRRQSEIRRCRTSIGHCEPSIGHCDGQNQNKPCKGGTTDVLALARPSTGHPYSHPPPRRAAFGRLFARSSGTVCGAVSTAFRFRFTPAQGSMK